MPRPGLTREEKKAQTRERLLDAAVVVFARKGFGAASLDEIADEAGLTKGAVYSNFSGKDDLLVTLFEERVDPRMFGIADQIDPATSPEEQAVTAGRLVTEVQHDDRMWFLLGLEYAIHTARNPGFPSRRRQRFEETVQRAAELIRGRFDEDGRESPVAPEELAVGFLALSDGIALLRLSHDVPDDLLGKMLALVHAGLDATAVTPPRRRGPGRRR